MKYCWTTLHVRNMEESLHFYEGFVGLEVTSRYQPQPTLEICFLGKGETQVELIAADGDQVSGRGISLGFVTADLEKTLKEAKERGYALLGPPDSPNPRMRFAFVEDPNGYPIQFVEYAGK